MRILCRSGHLAFYAGYQEEINWFNSYFKFALTAEDDYYTFPGLVGAPDYSVTGKKYLNLPATVTFQGKPWEVMAENGFVFSIASGLVIPKASVTGVVSLSQNGYYFLVDGLLQPGIRTPLGQPILSYDGEFQPSTFRTKVTRYEYE